MRCGKTATPCRAPSSSPRAAALPDRPGTLDALKQTDFRQTVLLEGGREEFPAPPAQGTYRAADVIDYRPNRVVLREDGPAGWLVLTDVWFPGWKCTVNGRPAEVRRGDFAFRAVNVPEGPCEVVFTFEPESYRLGREISLGTALLLAALAAGAGVWKLATLRRGVWGEKRGAAREAVNTPPGRTAR